MKYSRHYRESRGISQRQLAAEFGHTGAWLSLVEGGKIRLTSSLSARLCLAADRLCSYELQTLVRVLREHPEPQIFDDSLAASG